MRFLPQRWPGARSQGQHHGHDLSHPFHHFVTVLLSGAIERHAQAICFGFRPDIVKDPPSRHFVEDPASRLSPEIDDEVLPESPSRSDAQFTAWLTVERPTLVALERSGFTRGPGGERGIPISFSVDGVLHYFMAQPLNTYGKILATFESRLVAIGASEAKPQPLRYIEIGYGMSKHPATSHPRGRRRFAEVDLEFQADNTFWVHIRGEREVDRSIRISEAI